jgi:hypothetical protein
MSGIVPVGNTQYIGASTTPANVTYSPNISNTFRFINTSATATIFVAVYNSQTQANAFVKPTAGASVPGVVSIAPGWFETVSGNFGAQNTNTVYCCAVGTGSVDVYVTPVRD